MRDLLREALREPEDPEMRAVMIEAMRAHVDFCFELIIAGRPGSARDRTMLSVQAAARIARELKMTPEQEEHWRVIVAAGTDPRLSDVLKMWGKHG